MRTTTTQLRRRMHGKWHGKWDGCTRRMRGSICTERADGVPIHVSVSMPHTNVTKRSRDSRTRRAEMRVPESDSSPKPRHYLVARDREKTSESRRVRAPTCRISVFILNLATAVQQWDSPLTEVQQCRAGCSSATAVQVVYSTTVEYYCTLQ